MSEDSRRRDPAAVALEAEELARILDCLAERLVGHVTLGDQAKYIDRAAAFIREAYPQEHEGEYYFVGVKDGQEIVEVTADSGGECKRVELFTAPASACARFFNVRRARLIVDAEPVRPPENWGAIDG